MAKKAQRRNKPDKRASHEVAESVQASDVPTTNDGIRTKLKTERRKRQQSESGKRYGLNTFIAVGAVVAVLGVATYFWYNSAVRDIVRTPLQVPKLIEPGPLMNQQETERYWGTYRSGVYFGLKTRSPHSPVVGLMWMPQLPSFGGQPPVRHWCDQGDGLPSYGWIAHDGVRFGVQQIIDQGYYLTTDFVKRPEGKYGGDWSARIRAQPIENGTRVISLFFYMALDVEGQMTPEITKDRLSAITGRTPSLGNFRLVFPALSTPVRYNYLIGYTSGLDRINESLMKSLRMYTATSKSGEMIQYIGLAGTAMPDGMPESRANFMVTQVTATLPFEIEIVYESGSVVDRTESLLGPVYEKELYTLLSQFDERFNSTFRLLDHGFDNDHGAFARAILSNMLGGIGYFYGTSLVKSRHTPVPIEYWPAPLFTAVPSRSFFPRGFLWDEGFHQLLVSRWDESLSRDIIGHWLDLLNIEGWIPREQILGSEARARVPAEFVVQLNENANPPTLFLPLRRIVNRLINSGESRDHQYLRMLYPRLRSWYGWFNRTQTGSVPSSYRWRGRNSTTVSELNPKTLTSGLDDYPRASHPTEDERHVDLRCWMAFASGVMGDIARALNESAASIYDSVHARLMDNRLLDELHWSDRMQRYSDYGLHTDSVKLERPPPPKNLQPNQRPPPPREKERVVKQEPTLGFVDSSFGYVSLFPFLLRVLTPDSPRLAQILGDLTRPELLWTPFGLRSLARNSPLYGKHNTEHDPPYWRGAIWININYLALAALHHYAEAGGENGIAAANVYRDLRTNVVNNIYAQYRASGYIWEQYDDVTGRGKGSHPFTGWSALVVSIMAEDYF